ncbi:MAG TPA: hypothetical protein VNQ73_08465 [Ilumatobacter sp.]|nr:hypothetical protein [Ilumatobacter sp.]
MDIPAVSAMLVPNLVAGSALAFAIGQWFRRLPPQRLEDDGWLLALRTFERDGTWYEERLRIKAWKDRLPETGGRFGGVSKRSLPTASDGGLMLFIAECRRGERTHWMFVAVSPVFVIVHQDRTGLALSSTAATINAPFIAVLRYNRARIAAILHRRNRR